MKYLATIADKIFKIPTLLLCVFFLLPELSFFHSNYPWLEGLSFYLNLTGYLMILLWLLSISSIGVNQQTKLYRFYKIYNWLDILWLSFLSLIILMINVSAGTAKEFIHIGGITFSFTLTRPSEIMYLIISEGILILTIISMLYQESILKHRPKPLKTLLIMLLLLFPYIGIWIINRRIKA